MRIVVSAFAVVIAAVGVHAYNSTLDIQSNLAATNHSAMADPGKPLAHLTPNVGWMNDPNGLFFDNETSMWHAYYQYNPNDNIWGLPLYWGHASSEDLVTWNDHGIALEPENDESGAFSGSIVIDFNNTSGLFDNTCLPGQRIVALYTEHSEAGERQYAAYSLDGGYTFNYYKHNPVLDINSTQFRDPKVFWHEETERWVMTLALSQEYKIQIYTSKNLTSWEFQSNFSHHGVLGYQYECPGLSKIPIVHTTSSNLTQSAGLTTNNGFADYKWVMFLSINPGAPHGGSYNEYFIGDFDGKRFTAQDAATRAVDCGKDFYAMQTFSNAPNGEVLAMAWASNWDYSGYVPTRDWRSSMTVVRNLTLRYYSPNPETSELTLYNQPVFKSSGLNTKQRLIKKSLKLNSNESAIFNVADGAHGLLEFTLEWKVNSSAVTTGHDMADLSLKIKGVEDDSEYLRLGYVVSAAAFFLDRGNSRVNFVHANPFFGNKVSKNLEPYESAEDGLPIYNVQGLIDRNLIELFFNDGSSSSTNLFFLSSENYLGEFEVSTGVDNVFTILNFDVQQLSVGN
ncbi:LADA_0H04698g1_1 [Lachancea dasiensis]|uniref:LADA_0H04698g1_1 n=1 Tax=Lachancea dasiensis TaxID=1072105 RepID=A0A1G4K0T5_9SACH|nr:LADA_0H04698g1_1 [Lachancea dasiensis]